MRTILLALNINNSGLKHYKNKNSSDAIVFTIGQVLSFRLLNANVDLSVQKLAQTHITLKKMEFKINLRTF